MNEILYVVLLFATVLMVLRQFALFAILNGLVAAGKLNKIKLSWWMHLVATAALVTATIVFI